eukprot:g46814.t1
MKEEHEKATTEELKEEQKRHEKAVKYQKDLEQQLDQNEQKRQEAYDEFLKDKLRVDEIVRKIYEEDQRDRQLKMEKRRETQKYIEEFQKQRAEWKQMERERMEAENRKVKEFANAQQNREADRMAKVRERDEQKNMLYKKLAAEIEKERHEREELENVRQELYLEKAEEARRQQAIVSIQKTECLQGTFEMLHWSSSSLSAFLHLSEEGLLWYPELRHPKHVASPTELLHLVAFDGHRGADEPVVYPAVVCTGHRFGDADILLVLGLNNDKVNRMLADREKQIHQRLELQQTYQDQMAFKQKRIQAEKEEEDELRRKMMAKLAEDDRIEQMNEQKRRMKQLEHKKAVEKMIEDRRKQFEANQQRELERQYEEERKKAALQVIIEEERQKLLKDHASKLLGYLPKVRVVECLKRGKQRENVREGIPEFGAEVAESTAINAEIDDVKLE